MENLISMQDIRTSLKAVADRAEKGETFIVVRNSRPAFRIVPLEGKTVYPVARETALAVHEMQERFWNSNQDDMITEKELDRIIHEVHDEQNKRLRK